VVVPETLFDHSVLRQLALLHREEADRSFGGNLGFDYRVYEVPRIPNGSACGDDQAR
jgi:hypothetical protein